MHFRINWKTVLVLICLSAIRMLRNGLGKVGLNGIVPVAVGEVVRMERKCARATQFGFGLDSLIQIAAIWSLKIWMQSHSDS